MNNLLTRQLRKAARNSCDGKPDLEQLCEILDAHYDTLEQERLQTLHATRLMSDELASLRKQSNAHAAITNTTGIVAEVQESLLVVDAQTRRIIDANCHAESLFGYTREQLLQRDYSELSPACQADGHSSELRLIAHLASTIAQERTRFDWQCLRADGSVFLADIAQVHCPGENDTLIRASISDISERDQSEQRLRFSVDFERMLNDICTDFLAVDTADYNAGIDNALQRVCEFSNVDKGSLYQFTTNPADRPDLVERTHHWGAFGTQTASMQRLLLDTELPWLSARVRQNSILHVAELDSLPPEAARERDWFERAGVTSFAIVPLTVKNKLVGLLSFQSTRPGLSWHTGVLDRLRLVGDICAAALQRAQAAEHTERLMAILEATPDLVAMSDRSGSLLYLNRSGRLQLGIPADSSLEGDRLDNYMIGENADAIAQNGLQTAVRDGAWHSELTLLATGRATVPVSQVTIAHRHEQGSIEYFSTIARDITAQQRAAGLVADSEERLRLALESAGMGTWVWEIDTGLLIWSERVAELFDVASENVEGTFDSYLAVVHVDDRVQVEQSIARAFSEGHDSCAVEHRVVLGSGETAWIEGRGRIYRDADQRPLRMIGTIADVTARKVAELELFEEKERALVTLQSIGDAVITTDEHGLVQALNPVAAQRLHVSGEEAGGRLIDELFGIVSDDNGTLLEHPLLQCLRVGRVIAAKVGAIIRTDEGEEFPIQFSAAPIRSRDGDIIGAVMIFHDVCQERSLYQRMSWQASHDALTGLINRREFENRLGSALQSVWRDKKLEHCLLYIDIDQFKVINDTCGHSAGDELLKRLTTLLRAEIRNADVLARIGGDEFCIVLMDCPQLAAADIAEKIRLAINAFRFVWQQNTFGVSVSIGLVRIDTRAESIDAVLSAADVACFAAKDAGRNRVSTHRAEEALVQRREMQWVSRITQACEDDRLSLFYHPIVATDQSQPARHFELLLRLRDPYGKLVPPNAFIPAAERYNLMPVVDRWVVRYALQNLVQLDVADPGDAYTLAINLSGSSLSDPGFLQMLEQELQRYRLAPGAICFEITETAAITNLERVIHFMHRIRKTGCHFSLDDFGSGLSSFAYLKDLPVDFLKIDRHFVKNVANDVVDHSMMSAINQIGHVMGLKTVAEGVETASILDKVCAAGIDYAQGFVFGEPQLATGRSDFERRESARIIQFA